MVPVHLQGDAVQTLVNRDVERLALRAGAEADVARDALGFLSAGLRGGGRDEGDFLTGRIDDEDAGPFQAPRGDINVAFHIDGHAVATVFRAEIDERLPFAVDQSVL